MNKYSDKTKLITIVSAITLISSASSIYAAGFQLKEQSAEGQGNSFAGQTAKAVDASTVFFNPAGMSRLEGNQVQINGSLIVPQAKYEHTSTPSPSALFNKSTGINGGVTALVPAAYAVWKYSEKVNLGISMNVPFGLSTKFDDDWVGAQYNILSEIETINIAPSISYKVNEQLSIGANLQLQKIKGKLTTRRAISATASAKTTLKADDTAFGFGLGLLYEYSDKGRIGFNYRSQIEHTLEGDVTTPALAITALNFNAQADITMPAVASIGIYHEVSNQWALLADLAWTDWSVFDELLIKNNDTQANVPDPTQYNWDDTLFLALGANYKYNDRLELKFGVAFDQGAANDIDRTAGIPDATRYWASVGASYKINQQSTVNVGFSHIRAKSVTVNEDTKSTSYSGTFKPRVNILNVGLNYSF
ncbi:MAG: outer membrane protein transport protein [Oceanospirillaceae bacterium]